MTMQTVCRRCENFGRVARAGLLLAVLALLFSSGQVQAKDGSDVYSKVRVFATSEAQMNALNRAGLVFDHIQKGRDGFVAVVNRSELNWLRSSGIRYRVLVEDMEAAFNKRARLSRSELGRIEDKMRQQFNVPAGFELGSMGGFYTLNEAIAQLDEMRATYPNLISAKQSIGTTIEGRPIWMVKISDNPDINEGEEPILYTGLMHAREPMGMETNIYFMFYLLENYGIDPTITFLVDNRELYFIPVFNPDGYAYNQSTNPNGGGMWRKNRRNNGGGIFGVDLNRNFDYQWGFDNSGSSPNPGSSTYRGTAPASEPETAALQNFAVSKGFTMAFNYHSFANSYNYPWGYKPNFVTPDDAQFRAYSQEASRFNGYRFGTPWQNLGYVTNGYSNDWFYGEQTLKNKTFSWTVEVGKNSDGFWPTPSRIVPLAEENVYSNIVLAWGVNGAPPAVNASITPVNPPIIIPATGGQFQFNVAIDNVSGATITFKYWTFAQRTTGGATDALQGPFTVTLAPGASINRSFTQIIPVVDPGSFNYVLAAGDFGNLITTDSFPFTISAPAAGQQVLAKADGGSSWTFSGEDVSSDSPAQLPETVVLAGNYPNPFNPSTTISYSLPQAENVRVVVYDLKGRAVRELVNQQQNAGFKSVQWNGRDAAGRTVASGVYVYRLEAGAFLQSRKMLLVK